MNNILQTIFPNFQAGVAANNDRVCLQFHELTNLEKVGEPVNPNELIPFEIKVACLEKVEGGWQFVVSESSNEKNP